MSDSSNAYGLLGLVLLLKPILIVVTFIVGIILLAFALTAIIISGLLTAIILLMISGLAIVLLHYLKVINLEKQPLLLLVPLVMFAFGYFSERFRIFSINPQTTGATGAITLYEASTQLIMLTVTIALIVVAVVVLLKRRR